MAVMTMMISAADTDTDTDDYLSDTDVTVPQLGDRVHSKSRVG
jgi:hypothetical protein